MSLQPLLARLKKLGSAAKPFGGEPRGTVHEPARHRRAGALHGLHLPRHRLDQRLRRARALPARGELVATHLPDICGRAPSRCSAKLFSTTGVAGTTASTSVERGRGHRRERRASRRHEPGDGAHAGGRSKARHRRRRSRSTPARSPTGEGCPAAGSGSAERHSRSADRAPAPPTTRPHPKAPERAGCSSTTCWATEMNVTPPPIRHSSSAETVSPVAPRPWARIVSGTVTAAPALALMLCLALASASPASAEEPTATPRRPVRAPGGGRNGLADPGAGAPRRRPRLPRRKRPRPARKRARNRRCRRSTSSTVARWRGSAPARAPAALGRAAPAAQPPAGANSGRRPAARPARNCARARTRRRRRRSRRRCALPLGSSIAGVPGFFIESFPYPAVPAADLSGRGHGLRHSLAGAGGDQRGRDRLRARPERVQRRCGGLDAVPARHLGPVRGRCQRRRLQGSLQPGRRDLRRRPLPARRRRRAANVRAAVFSYNHSQAYVDSVLLRAQLLGGTPPELLGAVTGLTEARFPVHAPAHFSDGFPTISAHGSSARADARRHHDLHAGGRARDRGAGRRSRADRSDSPTLGRLRLAARRLRQHLHVRATRQRGDAVPGARAARRHGGERAGSLSPAASPNRAPSGPATAGAQQRSPLSPRCRPCPGSRWGPRQAWNRPRRHAAPAAAPPLPPAAHGQRCPRVRAFRSGSNNVYLHPLRVGVQVHRRDGARPRRRRRRQRLRPTGSGSTGPGSTGARGTSGTIGAQMDEPHMFFQIRPAGIGAPPIDPKPILDGWVALENTSIFRAKGENPFLATAPTRRAGAAGVKGAARAAGPRA